MYLCCDDYDNCGESVKSDKSYVDEWEQWAIVDERKALTHSEENGQMAVSVAGLDKVAPRDVFLRSRRTKAFRIGYPALNCNPHGKIQANAWNEARQWEEWTIHLLGDGEVALQAWTGRFLSAAPEGDLWALSESIGEREKWTIEKSTGSFVGLKSSYGKYLCCDGSLSNFGKSVKSDRSYMQCWEDWALVDDSKALTKPGKNGSFIECCCFYSFHFYFNLFPGHFP